MLIASAVVSAAVLLLGFFWIRLALPMRTLPTLRLPEQDDVYFLAWLTGSRQHVKHVALLKLVDEKRLDHAGGVKFYRMPGSTVPDHRLEAVLFAAAEGTATLQTLVMAHDVVREVETMVARYTASLRAAGLLEASLGQLRRRVWGATLLVLAVLAAYLAPRDPVACICPVLAATLMALVVRSRRGLLNAAGEGWLALCRKRHANLYHEAYPKGSDLLLSLALFGWEPIRNGVYSIMIQEAFLPAPVDVMSLAEVGRPGPVTVLPSAVEPWTMLWMLSFFSYGRRWWDDR
ncbi:MAG: TIGR04222 domain-containing membrane protein [Candidatus Xenobia bacterium]